MLTDGKVGAPRTLQRLYHLAHLFAPDGKPFKCPACRKTFECQDQIDSDPVPDAGVFEHTHFGAVFHQRPLLDIEPGCASWTSVVGVGVGMGVWVFVYWCDVLVCLGL